MFLKNLVEKYYNNNNNNNKWTNKGNKKNFTLMKKKKRKNYKKNIIKKKHEEILDKKQISFFLEFESSQLKKRDILFRLRKLGHPISIFGENEENRFRRLKEIELLLEEKKTMTKGKKNVFKNVIMAQVNKELELALAKGDGDTDAYQRHILEQRLKESRYDKNHKKEEFDFKEDYILFFFKRILREWKKLCIEMPVKIRQSILGKKKRALQGQCRRDMKPLFKQLKKREACKSLLKKLELIVDYCINRNYIKAKKIYFELAIGNAPWPVGVSAPGIHERSGHRQIDQYEVAHILNDETQRKYIHAMERIMKFCQEKFPNNDITKNFNVDQDSLSKTIK